MTMMIMLRLQVKELIQKKDRKADQINDADKIQQMDPKGDKKISKFHDLPPLFSPFYHNIASLSM